MTLLALRIEEHQCGARDVRARALLLPRQAVDSVRHRDAHQLVPRRMELDLVDAVAVTIVRPQPRSVLVGLGSPGLRRARPGELPQLEELRGGPGGALALDRLPQREVGGEQVHLQRGRLVQHLVRSHEGHYLTSSGPLHGSALGARVGSFSSSSSMLRGQSDLSSRESERSERMRPSVWQRGQ